MTIEQVQGTAGSLLWLAVLSALISYLCWGVQPRLRRRRKQSIHRQERVRYSSDVNTELTGFTVRKNHWNIVLLSVAMLGLSLFTGANRYVMFGSGLIYLVLLLRDYYLQRPFQNIQTFMLTERGLHLFPERLGQLTWQGQHHLFYSWDQVKGYRVDGGYLQLHSPANEVMVQFEYAPRDYEKVRDVLYDLHVKRLELSDRIWVSQLDEDELYKLEDEACSLGWELLQLFRKELDDLNLFPEFGVMRNMPGDRLLDEQARSWLQLYLLDLDTEEKKVGSSFAVWQSNGNIGFLLGVRGQALVDRLNQWLREAIEEATPKPEEVVS